MDRMTYCAKHDCYYPSAEWCPDCASFEDDNVRCYVCKDIKPIANCVRVTTELVDAWVCWHCQCDHDTGEPTNNPARWIPTTAAPGQALPRVPGRLSSDGGDG